MAIDHTMPRLPGVNHQLVLLAVMGGSLVLGLSQAMADAGLLPGGSAPSCQVQRLATAREAARWLLSGGVTLRRLGQASGIRPQPDGPGYRWVFPDGVLLTDGWRRADGELIIHSWGVIPLR